MPPECPVPCSPDVDTIDPERPAPARVLAKAMLSAAYTAQDDSGHALRAVHARSHGLLRAPPQVAWSADLSREIDDGRPFRPWNGIADHRRPGAIMGLRKPACGRPAAFRSERHATPVGNGGVGPFRMPASQAAAGL